MTNTMKFAGSREAGPSDGNPSAERTLVLELELETLRAAAAAQEQLVLKGYDEMNQMLVEVERQRNQVAAQSEEMQRAHASLARIIDTMDEVLLVIDEKGLVARVNRRLVELSGYSEAELAQTNPDLLFVPTELDRLEAGTTLPYRTGQSRVYQLFSAARDASLDGALVCKDGRTIPTLFRSSLLFSHRGKKEGLVIVGTDMREIRAAMSVVEAARRAMRLVLDHVNEGLVTVDRHGTMAAERSRVLDGWFGTPGPATRIWEYLAGPEDPGLASWMELGWGEVFGDILPLEMALGQLPSRLVRADREFSVSYLPIHGDGGLANVLVALIDITESLAHERAERAQKDILAALSRSHKDRRAFLEFFEEVGELVASIEHPEGETLASLRRTIHTVKGNCAVVGIMSVAMVCHDVESVIAESEELPGEAQLTPIVRAWVAFADAIRPLLGLENGAPELAVDKLDYETLLADVRGRVRHTDLAVLLEAWPHERAAKRLERIADQIEGLARRWGQEPPVVTVSGDEARFPLEHWAPFWGVFPHLYRNALDHGIEPPEERQQKGKPPRGHIRIDAKLVARRTADPVGPGGGPPGGLRGGAEFVLEVEDDGRGVEWGKLRERAQSKGLPSESRADLIEAMFHDGVSTRDSIDERSGRGVGLAAVRQATEALRGRIEVESEGSHGTLFRMRFPASAVWIPPGARP